MTTNREEERKRLLEKGKLLWKLVTTTAGVADLTEPLRRVERDFTHLSRGQITTVCVIAKLFQEGCNDIDKTEPSQEAKPEEVKQGPIHEGIEKVKEATETKSEVVSPDAIFPPGEAPKD